MCSYSRRMAETSLDKFYEKKEDDSLSGDRRKVFEKIQSLQPTTCREVANALDKKKHQISGRFTELRDEGLIEVVGREDGHRLYEVVE